jgi:fumarate hydratase class I
MNDLKEISGKIYELIARTSSCLPDDVLKALEMAAAAEKKNSMPARQLGLMLENAKIAKLQMRPICQDTGTLNFFVRTANFAKRDLIIKGIRGAVASAGADGFLRANTIDSFSGKSFVGNLTESTPLIEWDFGGSSKFAEISLLLKGGGSENIECQYSLPDDNLKAERDIDGVRRCVLDSVVKAQGKGCPPGAVAVCVGGDRAISCKEAKRLFLRKIGQRNPNSKIAELEMKFLKDVNSLGVGVQGLGGKTFALDLFIEFLPRHPASYYVTVSHICWAWRRGKIKISLNA